MSISSEISRITGNIASAYTAVSGKGGTLPATRNSANLTAAIQSIPGHEGGSAKVASGVIDNSTSNSLTVSGLGFEPSGFVLIYIPDSTSASPLAYVSFYIYYANNAWESIYYSSSRLYKSTSASPNSSVKYTITTNNNGFVVTSTGSQKKMAYQYKWVAWKE